MGCSTLACLWWQTRPESDRTHIPKDSFQPIYPVGDEGNHVQAVRFHSGVAGEYRCDLSPIRAGALDVNAVIGPRLKQSQFYYGGISGLSIIAAQVLLISASSLKTPSCYTGGGTEKRSKQYMSGYFSGCLRIWKNPCICRLYFGENRVKFYECKKAKYMGQLNQYPGKSMSRSSIASSPGIIRRLINRFGFNEERVITFMKENIGNLHFGNTEGSNTLEGKDILVIGTPYHADFLYKLAAFTMGIDFDEDEEMEMQVIAYNGYRFRFKKLYQ